MKRSSLLVCAGITAAALTASGAAVGASAETTAASGSQPTIGGFAGARGLDIGRSGVTVLATADGKVHRVFRTG